MTKKAPKAYKDQQFLNSREARTLRIMAEYLEPEARLKKFNIQHTVVFLGSARLKPDGRRTIDKAYWVAEELAYRLAVLSHEMELTGKNFCICTGGGPGIMEAANRGANRAHANTIGYNISLPMEQEPNDYLTPELNFEFHYFFMRKLWFMYHAKAVVVFPGGFGTLDELFEVLTLVQTQKLNKRMIPILLYDKEFWDEIININKLVEHRLISREDRDLIQFFSSADEGFEIIKSKLGKMIASVNHVK